MRDGFIKNTRFFPLFRNYSLKNFRKPRITKTNDVLFFHFIQLKNFSPHGLHRNEQFGELVEPLPMCSSIPKLRKPIAGLPLRRNRACALLKFVFVTANGFIFLSIVRWSNSFGQCFKQI